MPHPEATRHRGVRHPSAILLATQLAGVLLYPFLDDAVPAGRLVVEVFGALVLALAVWSVRSSPSSTWIAAVLGVAASGLSVADAFSGATALPLLAAVVHAAFYLWAAGGLMRYMLADSEVSRDELFAVGATFTLVAWAFAYLFTALQLVVPHSFTAAVAPDEPRTWMELLFLSFTNLSSTGLSDVAPITPSARAVVMIEQLAGLAYVALFVSRVVGLTLNRQRLREDTLDASAEPEQDRARRP